MTELKQQDNNPWGKVILPAKQTFRLSAMLLTLLLVLLNTGIYFYQELYVSPLPSRESNLLLFGANVYQLSLTGDWWRYPISMILHADIFHLVLNCLALFVIGINCEALFGKFRMLVIYVVSGISASLFSALWQSTEFNTEQSFYLYAHTVYITVSVGASGAIMGIAAATVIFLIKEGFNPALPADVRALYTRNRLSVGAMIVLTLVNGMQAGTDNIAHLSGAATGVVLALAYLVFTAKTPAGKRIYSLCISVSVILLLVFVIRAVSFSDNPRLINERAFILQEMNNESSAGLTAE
ncbi:rhomboid family intramembrane serine protease [Morganella morganii]|uniref:rhomboid family intramembrane serine protease n=1 Tax=Morganella morganii TaxID=582 RepID=UPI0032DADA37